ncbi:3-oxoacyl- reductase FabG [Golovinomyces cichoracearum]|uniref:3-oxoacyl-reductase FabG n=1 Tax=Golovinomyces cichoracearum TaxID=62708 RepID=A0A420IC63_9PEZI|nr:3-oxoacyl- reductase FabG [Golovinomyces cichoracearum]
MPSISLLIRRKINSSLSRRLDYSTCANSPLQGQRALITGASRGIGAAIAVRFAEEGVQCLLAGRDYTRLNQVKQSLTSKKHTTDQATHQIFVGDVSSENFWKQFKHENQIDLLVNAAGITHFSPLFTTSLDLVHEVIRTNLHGTMLGCRTIGKSMMARKKGCIINVASLLGLKGGKGSTAYVASKAGIIGLTRSLAAELEGRNIRVNVLVPGYIETDMTQAMTSIERSKALEDIPLGRFGLTAEVADAAVFLASNKYANNCTLNLDGGLSAK